MRSSGDHPRRREGLQALLVPIRGIGVASVSPSRAAEGRSPETPQQPPQGTVLTLRDGGEHDGR